jgi:hypothetical protein
MRAWMMKREAPGVLLEQDHLSLGSKAVQTRRHLAARRAKGVEDWDSPSMTDLLSAIREETFHLIRRQGKAERSEAGKAHEFGSWMPLPRGARVMFI